MKFAVLWLYTSHGTKSPVRLSPCTFMQNWTKPGPAYENNKDKKTSLSKTSGLLFDNCLSALEKLSGLSNRTQPG